MQFSLRSLRSLKIDPSPWEQATGFLELSDASAVNGYANGKSIEKVLPHPSWLWTSILPPWASTIILHW